MNNVTGPWADLALHTIGWKSFQDLCSEVCQDYLERPVEIFNEANDGGQDAVFLLKDRGNNDVVGTVQCKHVSEPTRGLRPSDIAGELEKVVDLVNSGQAYSYILITNLTINAKAAVEIRNKLKALGVKKPHIFGKHFIQRAIRSSSRLRALVPQVYGLGDLSTIVDERAVAQTEAILGHWVDRLKAYVPTEAHHKAIRSIESLGIVLLLGDPSSGKSAIGAILSTIASDSMPYEVIFINDPRQFALHWNPHVKKRFFWVDDAFGSNRVRKEFVEDWSYIFPNITMAIKNGNRFLFTSRSYIYSAAKLRLGSRNLPEFSNREAIIEVGKLSLQEKSQILYNHVKFGDQTKSWKQRVGLNLHYLAEVEHFLPGISERLGNSAFTKKLTTSKSSLIRFMEEPREHLVETINALEDDMRGLLILIYVHRGLFNQDSPDSSAIESVSSITGIDKAKLISCLKLANGTFVRRKSGTNEWQFAHPTIFDALTEIVSNEANMQEALVRGVRIDFILNQFTFSGSRDQNRTILQPSLEGLLIKRLEEVLDTDTLDSQYLSFLQTHVSDTVFIEQYKNDLRLLDRNPEYLRQLRFDSKIGVVARAHKLGLLDEELRADISESIKHKVLKGYDFTIFEYPELLDVVEPVTLVEIGCDLSRVISENLILHIKSIGEDENLDLDYEPDHHFEEIEDSLNSLEYATLWSNLESVLKLARDEIESAQEEIRIKKEEYDKEHEEEEETGHYWSDISTNSSDAEKKSVSAANKSGNRSVFSDIAD